VTATDYAARWTALRTELAERRKYADQHANDLSDEGKDAERAFGRVAELDDLMRYMDREDGKS
jgi:hypothetical protein